MIGTVPRGALLDGSAVRVGDRILGLASNGLHTNGFSYARGLLARLSLGLDAPLPGSGERIGDALLRSHRWYGPSLLPELARSRVHALAHITGGGLSGNLKRVLPQGVRAVLKVDAWPKPPLFRWLIEAGAMPRDDARRTFNLGIGMAVIVAARDEEDVARDLERSGETVYVIGELAAGERGVEWIGTG